MSDPVASAVTSLAGAGVQAGAAALEAATEAKTGPISSILVPLEAGLASKLEDFLNTELPVVVQAVEQEASNIGSRVESWFRNVFTKHSK